MRQIDLIEAQRELRKNAKKDQAWSEKDQVGTKLSSKEAGVLKLEGGSNQHPISIRSASDQHPLGVGGKQEASLFRFLRYAAMILCVLMLGVGQMWGEDFTAAEIIASGGTTKSNVKVSSSLTSTTAKKLCDSQTSVLAVAISSNANGTYSSHYVEVKATSGTLSSLSFKIRGNSDGTGAFVLVFWSGEAASAYSSYTTSYSYIDRSKSDCDGSVSISVPANTKTVRIYRQIYVKDGSISSASGYTTVSPGGALNIFGISATSSAAASRTFKSGEYVYFKDASSNLTQNSYNCLWKVSNGEVYAYFYDDATPTPNGAWTTFDTKMTDGEWNAASAIYRCQVPQLSSSDHVWTGVVITRGPNNTSPTFENKWAQTEDQEPNVGKNLFYIHNEYADGKWKGSWGNFTPASKTVYFDNRNVSTWTTAYVRIGHGTWSDAWGAMTKVAGTKYLYSQSTSQWDSHTDFSIANKAGWTDGNHIDQPEKTYSNGSWSGSEHKMTKQTNYQQYAIDSNTYICPKATSVLEHECQFYQITDANSTTSSRIDENTKGMRLPQYTVTATGTNCTVSLVEYTADDFSASNDISSGDAVDPTRYVGVTVTPSTGYQFGSISLTEDAYEQHTAAAGGVVGKYAILADCEIEATCTPQTYNIAYKDGGGADVPFSGYHIGTPPSTHTYNTTTSLTKATKAGYVFGGWYTDYSCTSSAGSSLGKTAYTANITLYAKWTAISWQNLATGTFYGASAMVPKDVTVSSTEQYYPGVSSDRRFNLLGEGTSDATTGPMSSKTISSQSLTNTSAVTECMYFKKAATVASYVPTDHAIQFKIPSPGGQLEVWANDDIYLSDGSSETLVDISGNYAVVKGLAAGTYYLYAKNTSRTLWGIRYKKTHSVSAVTSTGKTTYGTVSADPVTVAEDSTSTITAVPATGYQVTNWAVSGSGSPSISPSGASNSNTTTLTMSTANATVTVTFGLIDYTITHSDPTGDGTYTISVAGGDETDDNTTANYGQTITLAATPGEGYEFTSWTVTGATSGDAITVTSNQFAMPAENVTVTATFTATATYTVTYKANGGSGSDVVDDAATSVASNTFTAPTGKVFGGWNTKNDGTGNAYAVGDAVSSDLTLYAQWKYKVLYLTTASTTGDDLYDALKDIYDVTVRAPRTEDITYNYSDTALVVLHESMDGATHSASNVEVGKIKTANIPILNTKSYFYGTGSSGTARWGWGKPNNGQTVKGAKLNTTYANIASHPIFDGLTITSDSITIIGTAVAKAMQPVLTFQSGYEGYTLATSSKKDDWSTRGAAIHELTAAQRSAATGASITAKYLMISVLSSKLNDLNADGVKLFQNAADYLITGSQWVPQYAITTSATNGSIATEVSSSAVTSAAAGTRVDITATPTEGYVFSSWSVYKTGDAETTVSTNAATSPTYFTMPAYAVTVSATFALDGHTVTYDDGGATSGGVPTDDNVYAEGAPVTVLGNTGSLAKTEHSFGGWTANVDLTIDDETVKAGTTIAAGAEFEMPDEDVTLTAVWTPNTYDITYHLNSGSWASSAGASSYTYGVGYTLPTGADITKTNYTFIGWFDNSSFTGSAITAIAADATGAKEYWAKWGTSRSIAWYVDGSTYSTGSPTTTTCEELGITTMPTEPADDYIGDCADAFVGWSTTNLEGDATDTPPAVLFTNAAGAPAIDGNKTFYAVFATSPTGIAANTTLWSETWTGATTGSGNNPSGYGKSGTTVYNSGSVTYTQADDGTYIINNSNAGGTAPELLLVKNTTWTISNIPTGGAEKLSLKYKCNNGYASVTCSTEGTSISGSPTNYIITTGGAETIELVFKCSNTGNTRLDDIELKTAYRNYRCICPSLEVTPKLVTDGAPIFITSAANKTVRSQDSLLIVGSGFAKNATLSLSSPASKFVLKSRTNTALTTDATGAIDAVGYIYYTPDEGDTSDGLDKNSSFTISDGTNEVEVETALIGRHLPANFVIAAKNGDKWYALPSNMSSTSTPAPVEIEVDNTTTPTKGLMIGDTLVYSLYGPTTNNITGGNGQYVRLGMHGVDKEGSEYAPMFGSATGTYTLGKSGNSQITSDLSSGGWWWALQQTNTSISSYEDAKYNVYGANNTNSLKLYNDAEKWGFYGSGAKNIEELRLLWAPDVYDVYLFTEGGTINSGNITQHTYSVSEELPTDVTRTGYTFDGWYAGSSSSGYAKGPYTHIPADTIPYIGVGTPTLYFHPKWTLISGNKCEEVNRDFITTYTAGLSDGASTINDVKYSFDGYDNTASVLSIASGSDESYIYLDPKMGDIKEVELYFSEIGTDNGDANTEDKGISYGFSDSDEADFDASAVSLTDKDKINRGTLSFRPASDGMQYFVFKPYGTSLKISNICVFYEAKTYSVTYEKGDGASGTAPSDATLYKYNELVTVADTTGTGLKKTGYTFRGWSDNTAYMFYQVGDEFAVTRNTTLTAVWQSNSGGGSGSGTVAIFDGTIHTSGSNTSGLPYTRNVEHTDVTTGLKYTLDDIKDALLNPSMTNNTGNGKTYEKYIQWGGGTGSDNYIEIKVPTGSTADLYIVSGASGGSSSIGVSATKGAADTYHELAYKSWSSSGTLDLQEVSDLSAGTYYINGKSDKLVIAELKVTITGGAYNDTIAFADGTSVVPTKHDEWPDSIIGVPRGSYILPPADPIAVGYAFLGWYKDAACSQEIKLDTFVVRGNKTIYAKWVENVKYFTGAASTDAWETDGNWVNNAKPSSTYPYCYAQVYVMKPVKLAKGTKAHVGHVDIVKSGTYESVTCEGSVTIADSAMLIIYDSIAAIANWAAPTTRTTTTKDDLRIKSSETYGNGALIMANYTGYNEATVEFATKAYSKISGSSFDERDVNQYFGIPFDSLSRKSFGKYVYTYYYEKWDNSWWPMSETEKIYPFLGYDIINIESEKKTFELEGKLVPTADKNLHLRSYEGWYGADYNENLLANSWTAPIDIRQFELSDFTNAEATIYMFNAGTASEFDAFGIDDAAWSGNSAGQYTAVPLNDIKWHPYAYARYTTIPSMQSFSIVTMDDDGDSYTHHDNAYLYLDYKRLVYDAAVERGKIEPMHAPRRTADASDDVIALSLKVRGASGLGDHLRILEHETFTDGFDNGWEASKLLGIIEAPSLFAASSSCELAVVAVPEMEGMVLTFQAGENDDNYTFTFEYPDDAAPLYLLDLETNTYTRILAQNTYSFMTTDKNFNERFVLTHNAPQSPTGLGGSGVVNDEKDVQKVVIDDLIYIRRGGELYSVDGKKVQ